jgi:hypothetical protein
MSEMYGLLRTSRWWRVMAELDDTAHLSKEGNFESLDGGMEFTKI